MFETDERFKAVERPGEREDLFESYMVELQKKVSLAISILYTHLLPNMES